MFVPYSRATAMGHIFVQKSYPTRFRAAFLAFLAIIQFSCKKDAFQGWTVFREPPPPLEIDTATYLIKNCVAPYPVQFQQTTRNKLGTVRYFWDFGDGQTSTDQNPNHIYANPGNYTVKFKVENEISSDSIAFQLPELALASVPIESSFNFGHTNNNNFAPTQVRFDNRSKGSNQFYWYFGDGQESSNDNPVHIFQEAGTYNVRLRGTCTNGSFDEAVQTVLVLPAPKRIVLDSMNLSLPPGQRSSRIYVEYFLNNAYVGRTEMRNPSSFPTKYRRANDFRDGYIFDFVQFSANEVLKFRVFRSGDAENPPFLLTEILLSTKDIQNRFYPRAYFQVEPIPAQTDTFLDLYFDY